MPLIPVLARGSSCEKALYRRLTYHFPPDGARPQAGPLNISVVSVPVMARGPSSERALCRGPVMICLCPLLARGPTSKHLPFLLYCSCFGVRPVLGASAPQAAQLSFPFLLDFGASHPVCKRAPRAGGRLVILARMVTHVVTSMPKTAKCACVALQVNAS